MTRRAILTPFSEIEAVAPPVCPRCEEAMHYMGGTQKREDLAAGRSAAGWRCPECGDRAAVSTDLHLYIHRRGPWAKLDADFNPQLHDDAARAAGEVVIAGAEASIAAGRRTPLWVALGCCVAEIPRGAEGRELILDRLRREVGKPGSVFTTVCPQADAKQLAAGFREIAGVSR